MRRLPDRWGRFEGVPGLPLLIVATNAVVFLFDMLWPGLAGDLLLEPRRVYAGEVWRLVTFLFVPPAMPAPEPLWMTFWLLLLHTYAEALEAAWGTFRFTAYYLAGALATVLVGLFPLPGVVPNIFLNASLLLAFAALFPDFELLLFFILPVKVKYLGWLTWLWLAWILLAGSALLRLAVAAALVNYFLLLGPDLWDGWKLRWEVYRNRRRWRA